MVEFIVEEQEGGASRLVGPVGQVERTGRG